MKVVHLNTSDFGGAAMAAIQLHEALLEKGVESDLLTLNKTREDIPRHSVVHPFQLGENAGLDKARYKARRALEKMGVVEDRHNTPDNKNLLDRPPGHEIFTVPYSFFNVLDHPLVQAADVVHLHWVSYGMIDFGTFFRNCTKPIVWTLHDMNPFTGGCHHADDCTEYERTCGLCPQLKDPRKAHDYWSYKQPALARVPKERICLVAPSHWLEEKAIASSIFGGQGCEVVPNGFNTEHYRMQRNARQVLGLPADKKIILFNALDVSNPRKGMQYLLPALQGLKDENVLLVSIGGRSTPLPKGVGLHDPGFITSTEKLALYYSAADVFVLPSVAENLPNTISESLLCGTPVVAFRVGGIPEQVNPDNGLLVERIGSSELASAIRTALAKAWDRRSISRNAALRYDRRSVAAEYQRIYGTLG